MQTNWRKCSSRTIAHENALKRSLFVNSFDGRHAILVAEVDPAAAALFTVPGWKSFAPGPRAEPRWAVPKRGEPPR